MEFIRKFKDLSKRDVAIAGGKGASLGEMTQAKIPVPEGFVILSDVFEKFIKEHDLNVEIDAVLDTVNTKKVHTVDEASDKIQAMILNKEIPKDIEKQINKEFKVLKAKFVAVRSSATSEDSASAAWAGQLETYLNTTKKDLLENVKKCWASLFTPRAIFYRFEQRLHKKKISVAVVVQKMIESEESGIAFSVHPVTQDKNQLIIEAGFGLGEAIVSGQITPDSYVVDKQDGHIIDINVNEQSKGLYRKKDGGNEWKELGEKGEKQVLNGKEIIELAKLIVKIEKHYEFPVDVEWAKEKGKFYITQSRPITTLSNLKDEEKNSELKLGHYHDYQRLFQGTGMPFLVSHIFMDYYKNLKGLSVFVNNTWTTFLPKKTVDKTLKEGLELYSNKKKFVKYRDDFENYKKRFLIFFKRILDKEKISKEEVKKVLDLTSENFVYYSKTEFFYLDQAYEHSKKDKTTAENLKHFDKIKNKGREHMNKVFFEKESYIFRFFKKLGKQFSMDDKDLIAYTKEELLDLFDNKKVSKEELNGRRKTYIFQTKNKKLEILWGDEAKEIIGSFIHESEEEGNILKGTIANKGKLKGKVKVIPFGYDKFHLYGKMIEEMDKGDILVAETTSPEIMAACKKAGAILTNQGGLMSHAAIVSREFKIPCIVALGNVTDLVKDGDVVEVDADNGIVRILNKKNA
jgi:phosphoenolpyruvate synthase/pyruvate phosphate dikinase